MFKMNKICLGDDLNWFVSGPKYTQGEIHVQEIVHLNKQDDARIKIMYSQTNNLIVHPLHLGTYNQPQLTGNKTQSN